MHSLSRNIKIQTISAFVKARMAHKQNETNSKHKNLFTSIARFIKFDLYNSS